MYAAMKRLAESRGTLELGITQITEILANPGVNCIASTHSSLITLHGFHMNRIVHLALKVENLEKARRYYEEVFGFKEVETRKTRDPISRYKKSKSK